MPPRPAPYAIDKVPKAPRGTLRIATWNINSVRLRQGIVQKLARLAAPDVICLQETKSPDEVFPREALAKAGYEHQAILGMKGYNGVAILSRRKLRGWAGREWCGKADCRHISATLEHNGTAVELHNVYVPAGGDIPDPKVNPRFDHKLRFLREQIAHWSAAKNGTRILVGDLDVAPYETDVWSHARGNRSAEADACGARLDRHRAPSRAGADPPLHVVELSQPGLESLGSRPAPRSHLGDARPQAAGEGRPHRQGCARLEAAFRPRAGDPRRGALMRA
jgi:exodeoxyribonuclease III